MAPSWHDWKIVDWDVKPQHNQPTTENWPNPKNLLVFMKKIFFIISCSQIQFFNFFCTRVRPILVKNMILLASYVNKWTFI